MTARGEMICLMASVVFLAIVVLVSFFGIIKAIYEAISRWERNNEGNYILEISIPEGVNARLCLPSGYNLSEKGLRAGKQQVIVNKI